MEHDHDQLELPLDERYRRAQQYELELHPPAQPRTPPQAQPWACPGYCPTCPRCRERN